MHILPRTPDMSSVPAIVLTRPSPKVVLPLSSMSASSSSSSSSTAAPSRPRTNPLSALGFDICSENPAAPTGDHNDPDQDAASFVMPTWSASAGVPAATTFTLSNPFSSMSFSPLEKPRLTQEVLLPAPSMLRRKKRQQDVKWTLLALLSAGLWIWAMIDYGVLRIDGVVSACGLDRFIASADERMVHNGDSADPRDVVAHLEAKRRSYRRAGAAFDASYPTYVRSDFVSRDSPIHYRPGRESEVPAGSAHVPVPLKNPFLDITYPIKIAVDDKDANAAAAAAAAIAREVRTDYEEEVLEDLWDDYIIDTSHESGHRAADIVDWENMIMDDVVEDVPRVKRRI